MEERSGDPLKSDHSHEHERILSEICVLQSKIKEGSYFAKSYLLIMLPEWFEHHANQYDAKLATLMIDAQ